MQKQNRVYFTSTTPCINLLVPLSVTREYHPRILELHLVQPAVYCRSLAAYIPP